MDKLKMHSPNLTQENIARIREIFPGCITEARGEDGKLKLAGDFDQLRQELSESIVEGPQDLVKELTKVHPLRVVFRDSGFASDAVKINVEQIFRQISPGTEVKSI